MVLREWWFHSTGRKFYLVNSGYANTDWFLASFQGERYQLSQFDVNAEARRQRGPRDLYNHHHAQLRNVVEKAFGILKRQFKMLRQATPFSYKVQCRIALASCVIHNFIKRHQETDRYFNMQLDPLPTDNQVDESSPTVGPDESRRGDTLRTMITEMLSLYSSDVVTTRIKSK
ncbi:hypothetical protein ACMD2_09517, partial [Ananas comosus]